MNSLILQVKRFLSTILSAIPIFWLLVLLMDGITRHFCVKTPSSFWEEKSFAQMYGDDLACRLPLLLSLLLIYLPDFCVHSGFGC